MKNYNIKRLIVLLSFILFIFLCAFDLNKIAALKKENSIVSHNNSKKYVSIPKKKLKYTDIINALNNCSDKFVLNKIDKNEDKDYINVKIQYKGGIEGLIDGLKQLQQQEILRTINDIKISNAGKNQFFSEIDVNFYKYR